MISRKVDNIQKGEEYRERWMIIERKWTMIERKWTMIERRWTMIERRRIVLVDGTEEGGRLEEG
jgi:hypothetical protein